MPPSEKKEFKTISKRGKNLLAREEDLDVEFKESVGGLDSGDLVAFANSDSGGSILIGIRESKTKGKQEAHIIGCARGDREKLSILNRAESCVPPVEVKVFLENTSSRPFYRIEIPAGRNKPYCTSGGTYKIRGDGRTMPLSPGRLLAMFMTTESEQFIQRFREATITLERELATVRDHILQEVSFIADTLKSVDRTIDWTLSSMAGNIESSLGRIFSLAESAESNASDALSFSDETLQTTHEIDRKIKSVEGEVADIATKVETIMKHLNIEDPNVTRTKAYINAVVKQIWQLDKERNKEPDETGLVEMMKKTYRYMPQDQVEQWVKDSIQEIKARKTKEPNLNRSK